MTEESSPAIRVWRHEHGTVKVRQCGKGRLVAAPTGKQIGVQAIGQRDAGDRNIGTQGLFNQIPFERAGETASPAALRRDCNDGLFMFRHALGPLVGNTRACQRGRSSERCRGWTLTSECRACCSCWRPRRQHVPRSKYRMRRPRHCSHAWTTAVAVRNQRSGRPESDNPEFCNLLRGEN